MTKYLKEPVSSVRLIKLPRYSEENGDLVVIEGSNNIPFNIARIFIVHAPHNSIRGQHAHKRCAQFLICSSGSVIVTCEDGVSSRQFELNDSNFGLFIPCGIWAEQLYLTKHASLTVLCSMVYEKEDYIREYSEFLTYRNIVTDDTILKSRD